MFNTFEKYSKSLSEFISTVLEQNPDYIVPVKKKGCKLLRYAQIEESIFETKVRYKDFFENTDVDLSGKKIAVIDDAAKFTSSLKKYRDFFEDQGATVETYSFVGHKKLLTGERNQYDNFAHIYQYLEESTYQEYIVQQSSVLSKADSFFDIDHFAVKTQMTPEGFKKLLNVIYRLGEMAYTNDVYTPDYVQKICVYNIGCYGADNLFPSCVSQGALQKIRLAYNSSLKELTIIPLSYPKWNSLTNSDYDTIFQSINLVLPYVPCESITNSGIYFNIVFCYQLYLLKYFLSLYRDFSEFNSIEFVKQDMIAFVGSEHATLLFDSAEEFINNGDFSVSSSLTVIKDEIILPRKGVSRFSSVIDIMEELRRKYNELVEGAHTLRGVRYFISYEEMLERYDGNENLMRWIDILCDRGALVTRNYSENGIFYRACRSGEMNYDHISSRTEALISLAINCCSTGTTKYKDRTLVCTNPTFLNKALANFVCDYPASKYDVHSLYTRPHFFGPLVYSDTAISGGCNTSLYRIRSDLFAYSVDKKMFVSPSIRDNDFRKKINEKIGNQDAVPYIEVINYFGFINQVHSLVDSDSFINAMAICRNQDIYDEHVCYNLQRGHQNISDALVYHDEAIAERLLREAAINLNSASDKLAFDQGEVIQRLKSLDCNLEYDYIRGNILDSFIAFSDQYLKTRKPILQKICFFEKMLVNLILFRQTNAEKYFKRIKRAINKCLYKEIEQILVEIVVMEKLIEVQKVNQTSEAVLSALIASIDRAKDHIIEMLRNLYPHIQNGNTKYSAMEKRKNSICAKNNLMNLVNTMGYKKVYALYYNYDRYKNITDAKDINVISKVQDFASCLAGSGKLILGTNGNAPFGLYATDSMSNIVHFVQNLKEKASQLGNINIRFSCDGTEIVGELDSCAETVIKGATSISNLMTKHSGFVISQRAKNLVEKFENSDLQEMFSKDSTVQDLYIFTEKLTDVVSEENIDIVKESVSIGIITALYEEYVSVKAMLKNAKNCTLSDRGSGHSFLIGEIDSKNGKTHKIALTQTIADGTNKAATRATKMIDQFPNLKIIFMVGIAGGTPILPSIFPDYSEKDILENHVRLGDIVVASGLVQYDYVKQKVNGKSLKGSDRPPCASVVQAKHYLDVLEEETKEQALLPWNCYVSKALEKLKDEYSRPNSDTDVLRDYNGNPVQHPQDPERHPDYPKVFYEKYASGNKLIKDPECRDSLKKDYGVFAIEMETIGVADACWENNIGYFGVRGITDYCDTFKNDIWHKYSALVAAAYTKALIEFL